MSFETKERTKIEKEIQKKQFRKKIRAEIQEACDKCEIVLEILNFILFPEFAHKIDPSENIHISDFIELFQSHYKANNTKLSKLSKAQEKQRWTEINSKIESIITNDLCSAEMYHKFWETAQYSPNYLSTYQDQYKHIITNIIEQKIHVTDTHLKGISLQIPCDTLSE